MSQQPFNFAFIIPKIWGSVEQKLYAKFTRPFFPNQMQKEKVVRPHETIFAATSEKVVITTFLVYWYKQMLVNMKLTWV